ncbi:MAG: hydrogenase iron-sulfur subunit [Fibrobacteria bacterium]|nr:hydrogenase iron-sulfur subunit [Fibrobacteria bacterium]
MAEKKIALYVCSGCGIGDALNVADLEKNGTDECKDAQTKTHAFLCSQEGIDSIKNDIANEGVNRICVAACSQRAVYDAFDFEGCITERVNIREQVAWSHKSQDEDSQMMAEDYIRMGLVKLNESSPVEPFIPEEELSKDILVVGGGVAGLTAAKESAEAGYKVILVEKEAKLGGYQANLSKVAVLPYKGISDNNIGELVSAVESSDKITVYTSAAIEKTDGSPGLFSVTIKHGGESIEHKAGAIVMAAGWQPYDPSSLGNGYGYGKSKDVITNAMFEELIKEGTIARPSDGRTVENVVFLQCAGQRDPEHLSYCSSFCCITALKQALQVKEQNSNANVYVVYKEMRTAGHAEDLYRAAQEAGVIFIRSQEREVQAGNGLAVEALDELLGEKVLLDNLDMVVLATGVVPATATGDDVYAKVLAEGEEAVEKKKDEMAIPPDIIRASDILNLSYRQGPELPALFNDFPDSHFICFPYETRRTGIYAAGCVRRAMGISAAMEDARGAAMKAIQSVELITNGQAVHPRAGDLSYADFNLSRCTQCKRCTVECPFGAINEDEKGNPQYQATRCRRCGICMGACPERIIGFKDYSVPIIGNMIKIISMPEEDEEKPRILVFACENDAYPALDMVGLHRMQYNAWVRVIPLRCLGSMNLVWIADSLSSGFDGILLLGCQHGDDYQCHFVRGSELSKIRLSKVSETLDRMQLEAERVRYETLSINDYHKLPALLDEFAETLDGFGANPFKEF